MSLIMIVFLVSVVFFLVALVYATIFRVTDVHIGVPSSLFVGRIKREKVDENSVPIRKPYPEGFNIKRPWWTIEEISREVQPKDIKERDFPVGLGGTVKISGIIQYRISDVAAYRYMEVNENGIKEGLDAELEQIIRYALMDEDVDTAIIKTNEISNRLWNRLTTTDLRTTEQVSINVKSYLISKGYTTEEERHKAEKNFTEEERRIAEGIPKERPLEGKTISYAEHAYGIEVLKAKINTINPDAELKKSRDKKQEEKYQQASQTTEMDHLMKQVDTLRGKFPGISDPEIWEYIQIWQEQTTQNTQKIKVEGADVLTGILANLLGGKK